jgi:succinate---hydroxymethylglutarate CoA-transferase
MGLMRTLHLPNGVETQTTAFPIAITDYELEITRPPPELGAHTDEVAAEWLGETLAVRPDCKDGT